MENILLKKGDIIRLEKGMQIYAEVPEYVLSNANPFSTKKVEKLFIIGKIYKREEISKIERMGKVRDAIKDIIKVSDKQVENFINSLELDFSAKEFDTSIYEGEYVVDYDQAHIYDWKLLKDFIMKENNHIIHCYKKDNPSVRVVAVANKKFFFRNLKFFLF